MEETKMTKFAEEIRKLLAEEKEKGIKKPEEYTRDEIDAIMGIYIPSKEELEYEEMRNPRLRDDERI